MIFLFQKIPFQLFFRLPVFLLGKLLSHEKELLSGMGHHIGVGSSQVCLLLGRSARHFPDHGFLSVHDVVMGKSQHVVLTVGIDHAKGQLAMMIPAEDRIQAHVAQKIISPAGVPFEIKAKSVLFHRSGDAGPGS